jgi:hypothetical protein
MNASMNIIALDSESTLSRLESTRLRADSSVSAPSAADLNIGFVAETTESAVWTNHSLW